MPNGVENDFSFDLAVLGLGYVGGPCAIQAASRGLRVVGIDLSEERVHSYQCGEMPVEDARAQEQLGSCNAVFTTELDYMRQARAILVCVPTPSNDRKEMDPSYIIEASESIGKRLVQDQLVVIESTVAPGTTSEVVVPILQRHSGLIVEQDFCVAHCPEKINPGDTQFHVGNIPRIYGASGTYGASRTERLYRDILDVGTEIRRVSSIDTAECVKLKENTARDVAIAIEQQFAMGFDHLGVDAIEVAEACELKPFGYPLRGIRASTGVGGHCIAEDPNFLSASFAAKGYEPTLLQIGRSTNDGMPTYAVQQIAKLLNMNSMPLKGSVAAVLGVSYKPEVADVRKSPALEIVELLRKEEVDVRAFDPFIDGDDLSLFIDTVRGADIAILAVGHNYFKSVVTPSMMTLLRSKIVFDASNSITNQRQDFIDQDYTFAGIGTMLHAKEFVHHEHELKLVENE